MISLKNIERYYNQGLQKAWVLRDINLEIEEGSFITIMGPSGSGKTTLLNIIGMLDEPNSGEYYFLDEPVHKFNERKRSNLHKHYIGFIFQAYHLIDELTVYENIETPLHYKKVGRSQRKAVVADILDRFNMVAKKDLFPHQLSGGQQQLVGVARAVVGKPKLLLADEPTGNLHSSQGEVSMDTLAELHRDGMTILQVTHNEENAKYGDRIVELWGGFVKGSVSVEGRDVTTWLQAILMTVGMHLSISI